MRQEKQLEESGEMIFKNDQQKEIDRLQRIVDTITGKGNFLEQALKVAVINSSRILKKTGRKP